MALTHLELESRSDSKRKQKSPVSTPRFPFVVTEKCELTLYFAVYCNFNPNEPFWGHYWGLYNARRCIMWCFFSWLKLSSFIIREKEISSSLSLCITAGLAGPPPHWVLVPETGAVSLLWKGCGQGSILPHPQSNLHPQPGPRGFFLPPWFFSWRRHYIESF